ncbi:MAG: cyclopropane-fatty-acyl-phospholipid synthase family protein [Planctomycetia bacterium]|nr:cyclopropane-fatty-acyl-phospholipid synthase family protein [Planctomycetia bacterium]
MIEIAPKHRNSPAPAAWLDRLARRLLLDRMKNFDRGELVLQEDGTTTGCGRRDGLHATLRVHQPRFFRSAVFGGTLGIAESYLRGDWDCDDLTSLFRISLRNFEASERLDGASTRLARLAHRIVHWLRDNSPTGSRRNIAAHYDLGNDFYRLWLDDTLAYSGAVFTTPDADLAAASQEKFDRVCRKLDLAPEDHLLEIGSGWGGFALHAAENYGCRITTTTISEQQFATARERFERSTVGDRIELLLRDYRELNGRFDKLASIEMIEAVGYHRFDDYFRRCSELLRPDGTFVIQAIVMPERGYARYLKSVDFIQRHVFPGGCLPTVTAMLASIGRTGDLRFVHGEDFAPHYAETLRRWRRSFQAKLDEVRRLGYPEEFIRLWNYYLCYCEASFEERYVGVVQLQFDKPECRRDPARLSTRAARSSADSELSPVRASSRSGDEAAVGE